MCAALEVPHRFWPNMHRDLLPRRGVGLTLLFRFFGDAGSSLVGPLVPEAMLDDGAALLSLRSQLGSPVALAAAQPQVRTPARRGPRVLARLRLAIDARRACDNQPVRSRRPHRSLRPS